MATLTAIPTTIKSRFSSVSEIKSGGETFTPPEMAEFVADKMVNEYLSHNPDTSTEISILDPAAGDGELLIKLVKKLSAIGIKNIKVVAYEINAKYLERLEQRLIESGLSEDQIEINHSDFLNTKSDASIDLFNSQNASCKFDLIISNPPYVRTQILGTIISQTYRQEYNLNGRIDLYHIFLTTLSDFMTEGGILGIITSNRFLNTKSGVSVRETILRKYSVNKIYDLGDTQLFNAAVLPAIMLLNKKNKSLYSTKKVAVPFIKVYETNEPFTKETNNIFSEIEFDSVVKVNNKNFKITHGILDIGDDKSNAWVLSNTDTSTWLKTVSNHTWLSFKDLGKIKVGVKTCADKIFIKNKDVSDSSGDKIELLHDLITHHIAGRYKAKSEPIKQIIYPYVLNSKNKQVVKLEEYPNTKKYFEDNRSVLESRTYLMESNREWYELWVPHNPNDWVKTKLVFRDISEKPTFWIDQTGAIVNGDCYWMALNEKYNYDHLLLLNAVANSTFIEKFYDYKFNNKLYSGRRRFITQYVEKFPVPDPLSEYSKEIVMLCKILINGVENKEIEDKIDNLVWLSFGLS